MFAPVIKVQHKFVDVNGNISTLTYYVPISFTDSQLASAINTMYGLIKPLTDAAMPSAHTSVVWTNDSDDTASLDSDVNTRVRLFYRNEEQNETIDIPSPKAELFETEGAYAGIRTLFDSPQIADFNTGIMAGSITLVTPENEPFPTTFIVGGKML